MYSTHSILRTSSCFQWAPATLARRVLPATCQCPHQTQIGARHLHSSPPRPSGSVIPDIHYPLLTNSALAHQLPAHYHHQIGIIPSIITQAEHDLLVSLCQRKLKRSAFLPAHFDKVISGYREMSASHWKVGVPASVAEENERQVRAILAKCYAVLDRARQDAREGGKGKMVNAEGNEKWSLETGGWLAEHILELNETGTIGAHVDHLTASGTLVAALSLISPTPVVFQHVKNPKWTVEIQAEPGSLYFQMNDFRYDFTHAVPKPAGQPRISIMFRDQYVRRSGVDEQ